MSLHPSADSESFYDVYTGAWTNWDHGAVFGATLTLGRSEGTLLVAFVALFVTIVGTRSWRLACFALHQALSSTRAQDGLYHQRQAILRNSSNAASSLIALVQLSWAWRRISRSTYRQAIPITFAVLFTAIFTVASGFSSRIVTGNQVLISSSRCGHVAFPLATENFTVYQLNSMPFYAKQYKNAANYVQQCYTSQASGGLGCNTFDKKRLPMVVTANASCPFSGGICRHSNKNLLLDTGYLDSHKDFGLNSPTSERFQYRWLVHCSPLITDGYKSVWNLTNDRSYTRYSYGQIGSSNYTYEYTNDAMWETAQTSSLPESVDYEIEGRYAIWTNGSLNSASTFNPIPPLVRPDADVSLFFLSAGSIFFSKPTFDDWYRATHKVADMRGSLPSNNASMEDTVEVFGQDEPASPLACATQEQYCNPNLPEESRCEPLRGRLSLDNIPVLFPEQAMQDRLAWFLDRGSSIDDVVAWLGSQSLTSRDSLGDRCQGPLPNNQWQKDVQNWFETCLAFTQAYVVNLATGPSDASLQQWVFEPNTTGQRSMCRNQKILSTAHMSFSLFGLYFVFCLGSLIILVSFILEPILNALRKRHNRKTYQRLEWCTNETLQLQRLAHEEISLGTWSHAIDTVPVTERDELLAVLDIENPEHPRLRAPSDDMEEEEGQDSGELETHLTVNMPHKGSMGSGMLRNEDSKEKGEEGHDIAVPVAKRARAQTF